MKRWIKSLLLVSFVYSVVGCGVPVPSFGNKVVTGRRIQANDLSFAVLGETSIAPFTERLGEPWAYYHDLGVAVYYWETQEGQWLWRVSRDAEYPGGVVPITRLRYLFVAFDERGRYVQWTIIDHPKGKPAHDLAASWRKTLRGEANAH